MPGARFNDTGGNNEALVTGIVKTNVLGFYVFSAPWETISALLANINKQKGYNLNLPAAYMGPNYVYAISIAPSGSASLVTYNSNLNPPSTYPVLPLPVASASCPGPDTTPSLFSIAATGGINGAVIPEGINTNETIYMIRHAEAHPTNGWDEATFWVRGNGARWPFRTHCGAKSAPHRFIRSTPHRFTPALISLRVIPIFRMSGPH